MRQLIFLYVDDILLIAPSVSALQSLLSACEDELRTLDMQLNTKSPYAFVLENVTKFCVRV